VTNYSIEAKDGEIGQVNDFVIDDENWTIRYIIVGTRNWWPGKTVLISPEWITSVSWTESKAYADLSREAIRNSPQYNPSEPIDRQYESRLYDPSMCFHVRYMAYMRIRGITGRVRGKLRSRNKAKIERASACKTLC
jgi:hypothetical protein